MRCIYLSIIRKINLKEIFTFLFLVFIYFLPSFIFRTDNDYYNSLNGFKVPAIVFIIAWTIIYICNSFFITYHLYHKVINQNDGSYQRLIIFLVTNYVFSSLFPFVFFTLHNLFLSYLTTLFSFVTILLSMMEASLFNKKLSLLLLPNVLWTLFATIISIMYYLEN